MTLFRLDASINPATSSSRAIADIVEAEWQAADPDGTIVRKGDFLTPARIGARRVRP